VVAAVTYGAQLVQATMRMVEVNSGPPIRFKTVEASRGKHVRASPVGTMLEKGLLHLVGTFPLLEEQLNGMTPAGFTGSRSPDRADACVWAATRLMEGVRLYDRAGRSPSNVMVRGLWGDSPLGNQQRHLAHGGARQSQPTRVPDGGERSTLTGPMVRRSVFDLPDPSTRPPPAPPPKPAQPPPGLRRWNPATRKLESVE
jgi:hypothetical protein